MDCAHRASQGRWRGAVNHPEQRASTSKNSDYEASCSPREASTSSLQSKKLDYAAESVARSPLRTPDTLASDSELDSDTLDSRGGTTAQELTRGQMEASDRYWSGAREEHRRPRTSARPTEYTSRTIAKALEGVDHHSFMVKNGPHIPRLGSNRDVEIPDKGDLDFVAILAHRAANPILASEPEEFEIWTRHYFHSLVAHVKRRTVLPLFHHSDSDASVLRWERFHESEFAYLGRYMLLSSTLVRAHTDELQIFIEQRPESRLPRPRDRWQAMYDSDWLRVRVRRVEEGKDPVAVAWDAKDAARGLLRVHSSREASKASTSEQFS